LLLEGYEASAREQIKLFEAKVFDYVDRQTLDTLQKAQRLVHDSVGAQRRDFEAMVVKLGENIQRALSELQQQTQVDFNFYQNDTAQKAVRLRNEILLKNEEQLRDHVKAVQRMKDDFREGSQLDHDKIQLAIEAEVGKQTKPLTSQIKDFVLVQLNALDKHQKSMAEKLSALTLGQASDGVKMQQIQDMFDKHMALMEALNKKSDAQGAAIVENRKLLSEKIASFAEGVSEELRSATKYFDLKSYDASIEKIEKDVTHFFTELAQVRADVEQHNGQLAEWRKKLASDMQVFYDEYDDKIRESMVTEEERQLFKEAITDLNSMVERNSENIRLIAKELTDSQQTLGIFDSKVTSLQTFVGEQMMATDRAFHDQSAQYRKLSQDLFDALGMREAEDQFEQRLQKQKVHYEGILNEIKLRIQEKLDSFDPSQARKDLQNFVYNTYNDRQEQIIQELMLYMQKLMSMNNMVGADKPQSAATNVV